MDGHVSKSDFAKIYRCQPSYVTKLIKEKKIVLSEDGKKVNVEASLRLIEATGDPSKQGVRDRWDAYRSGKPIEACATPDVPTDKPQYERGAGRETGGSEYHKARTVSEQVNARLKELELKERLGEVAKVAPLLKAVQDAHIAARAAVMQLPDRLAQILASETDPQKVHEALTSECTRICDQVQRTVQRMKEQLGAAEEDAQQ